jgi:hypothetical protein
MTQSYHTPAPASTAPRQTAIDPVVDLLGGDRVIAFRSALAHLGGGALAGLLLSQFWYYSNLPTSQARDGWFYMTMSEIEAETGMTRTEQETARRRLRTLGLLEEDKRGIPPTLHFRLDAARMWMLLSEYSARQTAPESGSENGSARNTHARCSTKTRRSILQTYQGCCYVCGVPEWETGAALHMHRVVKGRTGGRYETDNIIPVCGACHIRVEGKTRTQIEQLVEASRFR